MTEIYADDPNDAFWLAQTYFQMHQYARTERILTRPFRTSVVRPRSREATAEQPQNGFPILNGNASIFGNGKGKEPATASAGAGPSTLPRLPVGPAAMINVAADNMEDVSRLVDMSVACRYLCAQALVRSGGYL
jgi:anaphase-promoting complex subunit 6